MAGHGADTIFALTTTRGKSGVAVIRISGSRAWKAATVLSGSLPKPGHAGLRILRDSNGEPLDQALVLAFESGASFTGERVCELQCHGSLAVIDGVLRELGAMDALRPAEAGEFTRRALENDVLDLTEVEGLADLIDAETEAQRKQAFRVLSGAIGQLAESWRADILRALALLEATIDFVDEDVPVDVGPDVRDLVERASESLRKQISGAVISERVREGFEVAIIGPPNIGKSTLLNRLAGRDAAITSEVAGTTRDVIEVRMDIAGLPVTLLDTAGLRDTEDLVEKEGVTRALSRAQAADLRVFLVDQEIDEDIAIAPHDDDLVVYGKADLVRKSGPGISGLTGEGIETLVDSIRVRLESRATGGSDIIRERHRIAVQRTLNYLDAAMRELENSDPGVELAAEELRGALHSLDVLAGRVDVEQILGEVFSSFCIGK